MAQQNINFGTSPDDPSADAIRTAFTKVQNNFTQIFTDLSSQTVLSVNNTPGAGITVNAPTGNVVISANIACVQVTSHTLAVGLNGSNNYGIAGGVGIITQSTDQIFIDLPYNVANVNNITASQTITANDIVANNSFTTSSFVSTGDLTGSNLISTGNIYANTGNANVGNVNAANGTFTSNVSVTGRLTAGNLTSLNNVTAVVGNFSGNITSLNANLGNAVNANYFAGNGYYLTDVQAAPGPYIVNGTSYTNIAASDGNVVTAAGGNVVLTVTSTGGNVSGYLTVTGNITAGNLSGADTISGNYLTGNLTTAAQPNITSVGTLTGLNVNGTVTATKSTCRR